MSVSATENLMGNEAVDVRSSSMATARQDLVTELFRDAGDEACPAALEGRLLRTKDVALLFQVSERAVAEWARKGKIPSVRTPGGHRRYPAGRILDLLRGSESTDATEENRVVSYAGAEVEEA